MPFFQGSEKNRSRLRRNLFPPPQQLFLCILISKKRVPTRYVTLLLPFVGGLDTQIQKRRAVEFRYSKSIIKRVSLLSLYIFKLKSDCYARVSDCHNRFCKERKDLRAKRAWYCRFILFLIFILLRAWPCFAFKISVRLSGLYEFLVRIR